MFLIEETATRIYLQLYVDETIFSVENMILHCIPN
jgi:hypothetical protein